MDPIIVLLSAFLISIVALSVFIWSMRNGVFGQGESRGDALWMGDEVPTQFGGLFATPQTVEKRRALVARFVRAYVKAIEYYDAAVQRRDADGRAIRGENYDDVIRIVAQHTGEPPAALAAALPYFNPAARLQVDDIAEQIDIYKALGLVDAMLAADAVTDRSFVPVGKIAR